MIAAAGTLAALAGVVLIWAAVTGVSPGEVTLRRLVATPTATAPAWYLPRIGDPVATSPAAATPTYPDTRRR